MEVKPDLQMKPLGVFDSGIGGLTVYRALRRLLPHEDFIYLGDTKHLPYGTKSKEMVERYTLAASRALSERGIKFLAVACNTISAQALDALQQTFPDLPYCGVISVGAELAAKGTRNGRIAVLATEGTVRSGIYPEMIKGLRSDTEVQMLAAGELVTLVEEGSWGMQEAQAAIMHSLAQLKPGTDTLVLACTHFPILLPLFQKLCPPDIHIIDGAEVTAQAVAGLLAARNLLNPKKTSGNNLFLVTNGAKHFAQLGAKFLGWDMTKSVMQIEISVL